MKKIQIISACLLWGGLLLSCSGESLLEAEDVTTGEMVDCQLQLSVAGMQTITPLATRVADSESVIDVDYGDKETTRASEAMSSAESKLDALYIVQFDGTGLDSKVLAVSANVASSYDAANNQINVAMNTNNGNPQKVVLVANLRLASMTVGVTTFDSFQKQLYSVSVISGTPSSLPMVASQDVTLAAGGFAGVFVLRPLLAKLNMRLNVASDLNMKNITFSIYGSDQITVGALRNDELGRTNTPPKLLQAMTNSVALNQVYTRYLAPVMAGTNSSVTKATQRGSENAPLDAAYIEINGEINGEAVCFTFYLGDGTPWSFDLKGGCCYNVSINMKGINPADLRVGNLTDLNKINSEPANCYVASKIGKGYSYQFDCTVQGNGSGIYTMAPKSVKVLWETGTVVGAVVSKVSLVDNGRKIKFYNGGTEGSALIAVYGSANGTGPALWSWHIWCTKGAITAIELADIVATSGTFSPSGKTTMSGLAIMDRNLGALSATPESDTSIGLTYQWGRKDPFPGLKSLTNHTDPLGMPTTLDPVGSSNYPSLMYGGDMDIAIGNPEKFLVVDFNEGVPVNEEENTGDWLDDIGFDDKGEDLWGTPNTSVVTIGVDKYNGNYGVKTIYDPCPTGWRMPPAYIFANAGKASKGGTKGMLLSGSNFTRYASVWLPMNCNRDGSYLGGMLYYSSSSMGHYYTASPYHEDDEQMGVTTRTATIWYFRKESDYYSTDWMIRANACAARCMKE